tara:strand:+ start:31602 stop:32777 length:1176 start_codon:yes stop_codon:yes gene_type:complete
MELHEHHHIIQKLTSLLEVRHIFVSPTGSAGQAMPLLIVVLDENGPALSQDLSGMVAKIFQEGTPYLYRIFSGTYAEKQLREGNLFFVHACTADRSIFRHQDAGPDAFLGFRPDARILERTEQHFQQELLKLDSFRMGAAFFRERQNHAQAAFMWHQYMELWFRTIELFCMGKERKCHNIREHQTYIGPFVPELGTLFNPEDTEELALLQLVDEAYIGSRYQNNFQIDTLQLQQLREKADRLQHIGSSLFQQKMAESRKSLPVHKPVPEPGPKEEPVKGPMSQDGVLLHRLKELTEEHFDTLKPDPYRKNSYYIELETSSYLDTSFMISNLLKVCIMALEANGSSTGVVQQPEHNVMEVLGYILDMVPYEEMEFLDKTRDLISELESSPKT